MENIDEDNFNRLAISLMEKFDCDYDQAIERLTSFSLHLVIGEQIRLSIPLQAALVTAVNTGKRAFLAGVYCSMPENVTCLVPWPTARTLNEVVDQLQGKIATKDDRYSFRLHFGVAADVDRDELEIVCNDWQGGYLSSPTDSRPVKGGLIGIGGVAAASLGVATAFLRVSGISLIAGNYSNGISLWRPDLGWLDEGSAGPKVEFLPKKYWLLGLGHLGQAFVWNIGMLPYKSPSEVEIMLQDYDTVADANYSAGLLCTASNTGQHKTRVCSDWLMERQFKTLITERKFDEHTKRTGNEPYVALCGFDSAAGRRLLEDSGFALIIEAALGGCYSLFDNIIIHTFPDSYKAPVEIWGAGVIEQKALHKNVLKNLEQSQPNTCGILAENIASKAISSSFVGSFAGALVISELLRGLHRASRFDTLSVQMRNIDAKKVIRHEENNYTTEMGLDGFALAKW